MSNIIRFLIIKDAQRLWVLLAAWGFVLTFKSFLYIGGAHYFYNNLDYQSSLPLFYRVVDFLEKALVVVIVPMCLHEDPSVGSTAFWFTRPLARISVLATKALFLATLFVCLPLVMETAVLALSGFGVKYVLLAVPEIILERLYLILPFVLLASITGRFSEYIKVGAIILGAWIVWGIIYTIAMFTSPKMAAFMMDVFGSKDKYTMGLTLLQSSGVIHSLLSIVLFGSLVVHQYLTRYTARTVRWAVVGYLLIMMLTRVWTWDFLKPNIKADKTIKITSDQIKVNFDLKHVEIVESSGKYGSTRMIRSRLDVSGVPIQYYVIPYWMSSTQMRYADGVKLDSPYSNFLPTDSIEADNAMMPAILNALGNVIIKNPWKDMLYGNLFEIGDKELEQFKNMTGTYAVDARFQFIDFHIASRVALRPGAEYTNGMKQMKVLGIQRQDQSAVVLLVERDANMLFDRNDQKSSMFDTAFHSTVLKELYALVNPKHKEAVIFMTADNEQTQSMMFNEGLRLKVFVKKYYFDFNGTGITRPVEWLQDAQLVRLESRSLAIVDKKIRIKNFVLPSVSTDSQALAIHPDLTISGYSPSETQGGFADLYSLGREAKEQFNMGNRAKAESLAEKLQGLIPVYRQKGEDVGEAVYDVNLVLGRVAVSEGRIEDAKRYLLEAGRSPGSPTLDSFGPNMSLAKDLLEKGEKGVVLQYFLLCSRFWTNDYGKLKQWTEQVEKGEIPDFGANLVY